MYDYKQPQQRFYSHPALAFSWYFPKGRLGLNAGGKAVGNYRVFAEGNTWRSWVMVYWTVWGQGQVTYPRGGSTNTSIGPWSSQLPAPSGKSSTPVAANGAEWIGVIIYGSSSYHYTHKNSAYLAMIHRLLSIPHRPHKFTIYWKQWPQKPQWNWYQKAYHQKSRTENFIAELYNSQLCYHHHYPSKMDWNALYGLSVSREYFTSFIYCEPTESTVHYQGSQAFSQKNWL